MKAELIVGVEAKLLYLTPENDEEKTFLKQAFDENLVSVSQNSSYAFGLPSNANNILVALSSEDRCRLSYALGMIEEDSILVDKIIG